MSAGGEVLTPASAADARLPHARTAGRADTSEGRHLLKFGFIVVQLGLLGLVLRQFQIESGALLRISLLGFAGFVVHYFLPLAWRLPFFACLSIAGIVLIFGPSNAAWLIGFGLVLVAICHLRASLRIRVLLLLTACGVLAAMRVGLLSGPWSRAIWPILGAMFMFRLIVYVYDQQHEKVPPSPWRTLAYFFPLPNICFPLFPVLDYKQFRRGYYDIERHRIYQIGVDWMTRGVVHLILYRAVNYYFTVAPSEVIDPNTLVQHIVANFMLYLRISGTFHLITGLLHLFGFNLLETHHRYCLSASFTDFWRRINIYWKDFMMKLFYYPMYFRLKRYGATTAVVLSTIGVFIGTWLLHSYQWFWLRGEFPVAWQDGIFWMTLAVLVVFNSLRELKHGSARSLSSDSVTLRQSIGRGARTVAIFFFICVLWSIWTCESLSAWLSMWDFLWRGVPDAGSPFPALLLAVAAVVFVAAIPFGRDTRGAGAAQGTDGTPIARSGMMTAASLIVLATVGLPTVYGNLGVNAANTVLMLRSGQLSRADAEMLERGYYEDLTRVNRFNSELWQLYTNRPVLSWLDVLHGGGLGRFTGDFLQQELVPSFRAETPYGAIQTNRWGMRDKEYENTPPPNTFRIAMLGSSTLMGWGVEADDSFEALLENDLNHRPAGQPEQRYEVLNFGVGGYYPLQQLVVLDKALQFQPDAVLYVAPDREVSRASSYLANVATRGVEIPYPFLREILKLAQVDADTDMTTALKRLAPYRREILASHYRHLAQTAARHRSVPVWVFLPTSPERISSEENALAQRLAREAGFRIIDLTGVYDSAPPESIILAEWDRHPNARGHRMIAEQLFSRLTGPDRAILNTPGGR